MRMTAGETHILISMEIRCLKAFFPYTMAAHGTTPNPCLYIFSPNMAEHPCSGLGGECNGFGIAPITLI